VLSLALISTTIFIMSCGNDTSNTETTEQKGKEYTSAYICPMHCEGSGAATAGDCPVCGMDYVANKDHKADEHNH